MGRKKISLANVGIGDDVPNGVLQARAPEVPVANGAAHMAVSVPSVRFDGTSVCGSTGLQAPGSQFLTPEERSHPMVAALAAMNAQIAQMSQLHLGAQPVGPPRLPVPGCSMTPREVDAINQDVDARMPDPDITELFDHFHLDTRHLDRFRRAMDKRKDTFAGDMIKIWELLEQARSPEGMLVSKIKEIEDGVFVGKTVPDEALLALSKKYKLDNEAVSKLSDVLAKYGKEKRQDYMRELDQHLGVSSRPSAMVMMSLRKLGEGLSLGRVGKPAPGSHAERQSRGDDRDERRRGDRDREDRGRDERSRRSDRDRDRGDVTTRSDRERSAGDRPDRSRDRRDRDSSRGDRQRGGDRDRSRSRHYHNRDHNSSQIRKSDRE
eukprot:TRINITY_DN7303_c0_g1_i2.p1 TRINITY_DN7303_c0_g1~~TRINITY_DN7303_c0_g1_i2.p1  ORF type:complete len:379 (-),score=47.54 TRINITY_DN7303_c0_g1_i2:31-1167(-)